MAIFKVLRCKCGWKKQDSKPTGKTKKCPRCGSEAHYSEKWYISYQIAGKKYIESAGDSKKFAEDALAKRKVQIREGKFFEIKQDKRFNEAVKALRDTYPRLSKDTVRMYENSIKNLSQHYISHVTLLQAVQYVSDYIQMRQAQGVSNSTINRDLETLKRLAKLNGCDKLFNAIKLLKENEPRKRFLSKEEVEALKKAINESKSPYLQLAVLISLDTGLRKREVMSLKWSELNLEEGYLEKKIKGGKKVYIPLTDRLKEVLKRYREKMQVVRLDGTIFCHPDGSPVRDLKRSFKTACRKAGIKDVRWHDLRRTFGSHFVMATKDLVALQQLLGHADFHVTRKHYAHLIDEHVAKAMKKFEEAGL